MATKKSTTTPKAAKATKTTKAAKTTKAPKAAAAPKVTKAVAAPKTAKAAAASKTTKAKKAVKAVKAEILEPEAEITPLSAVPEVVIEAAGAPKTVIAPEAEAEAEAETELDEDEDQDFDEDEEDEDDSDYEDEDESDEDEDSDDEDEFEDDSDEEDESASDGEGDDESEDEGEPTFNPKPRPPAKLERLQKILAQAGVASRRKAEEMIEQGRVQVNGKIVTELGTKADAGRDHIRVDGKLLQGAERLRYFVLNKPKGFVTTVKDPEGRPTVMQFFDKMRERLYPVGRLDYMSEGLLLVTNDGELANRLTRAAAGVEKTYLVKVAGQPSEDELDLLRGGVSIERGKPGEGRVRTSPARIRQVRQGDNPWYEVVLIEGRNRELRKMFEEVGHFVEKIRRVGYGPLILDQEPGNLRELDANELDMLRKAAEGKLRTPKSKEMRRRNAADALPTVTPHSAGRTAKPFRDRTAPATDYRSKRSFETGASERPAARPTRPAAGRPMDNRSSARGPVRSDDRPRTARPAGRDFGPARIGGSSAPRPAWKKDGPPRPPARFTPGPAGEERSSTPKPYADRPSAPRTYGDRPAAGRSFDRPAGGRTFGDKPAASRPFGDRPAGKPFGDKPGGRPFGDKPAFGKPAWKKPGSDDRPDFKRNAAPRREFVDNDDDLGPVRPPNLHIEEVPQSERSSFSRPSSPRPYSNRSSAPSSRPERSSSDRPSASRPYNDRPSSSRPSEGRPSFSRSDSPRPSSPRPFRSEGGLARPFTTSSGKPRAGGARPNSKPGSSSGRSYGSSSGSGARSGAGSYSSGPRSGSSSRPPSGAGRSFDRPSTGYKRPDAGGSDGPARPYRPKEGEGSFSPRPTRPSSGFSARPAGGSWKPKPSFGGSSRPSSGGRPKPGGFSKGGFKGKPGGKKRS